MKNCEAFMDRAKNILTNDKYSSPARLADILKSEILFVLASYMDISKKDLNVNISISGDGDYVLNLKAVSKRLKKSGTSF